MDSSDACATKPSALNENKDTPRSGLDGKRRTRCRASFILRRSTAGNESCRARWLSAEKAVLLRRRGLILDSDDGGSTTVSL
eukprot:2544799-Pyramimonas_sp.AAC.1